MNPDPHFIAIFIFTAIGFILTLAKSQFSLIAKQHEENSELRPIETKIIAIWELGHFFDIIAFARLSVHIGVTLSLIKIWPQLFADSTGLIHLALYWSILSIGFFLVSFLTPNILGHLKPNSLSVFTYYSFFPIYIAFWLPGFVTHKIYWAILNSYNYKEQFSFLNEQEQKELEGDVKSNEESLLEDNEREMIRNIFEFADRLVQEVMTPRVEIIALNVNAPLAQVIRVLNQEKPTRIPVYDTSVDNIIGVLYSKDFLEWITQNSKSSRFNLKSLIRPVFFVTKSKEIDDLMSEFRLTKNHMAIVLDEFGGTAGLITLEDILEEIVGEIYDEEDVDEKIIEKVKEGTYLVDPIISINDLEKELDIEIPQKEAHDVETLNGLLQSTLQEMPRRGLRVWIEPMDIRVLKVNQRKVTKLLVTITSQTHDSKINGKP